MPSEAENAIIQHARGEGGRYSPIAAAFICSRIRKNSEVAQFHSEFLRIRLPLG